MFSHFLCFKFDTQAIITIWVGLRKVLKYSHQSGCPPKALAQRYWDQVLSATIGPCRSKSVDTGKIAACKLITEKGHCNANTPTDNECMAWSDLLYEHCLNSSLE